MTSNLWRPLVLAALTVGMFTATYHVGFYKGELSGSQKENKIWKARWEERDDADKKLTEARENQKANQEAEWRQSFEGEMEKAKSENEELRNNLDNARGESKRLQGTIKNIIRDLKKYGYPAGADATGKRPANSDPLVLLADVLGKLDEAAGNFAAEADDARRRGARCEFYYKKVTEVHGEN